MKEKRKVYIFFTVDIRLLGGIQLYVTAKSKYLEENGWDVITFFDGYESGNCVINYLNKFLKYEIFGLRCSPYDLPEIIYRRLINRMEKLINLSPDNEIVIESHVHESAMWGELLAERINAKHICLLCNETFKGPNKHYCDKIDFYDFKHKRHELAGISYDSLKLLFEGYKEVADEESYSFVAITGPTSEDIDNAKVDNLDRAFWNICYFGRSDKGYVPKIIDDVAAFAKKHSDKSINFVIIGDSSVIDRVLDLKFNDIKNVSLKRMGDLVPIPKRLFGKVDVVIAGAGCAAVSVGNNAITIIADAKNYLSNGVYGCDTDSIFYCNSHTKQTDFCTSLERVLVDRLYEGMHFCYDVDPYDTTPFEEQLGMVYRNGLDGVYYVHELFDNTDIKMTLQMIGWGFWPGLVKTLRKIKK